MIALKIISILFVLFIISLPWSLGRSTIKEMMLEDWNGWKMNTWKGKSFIVFTGLISIVLFVGEIKFVEKYSQFSKDFCVNPRATQATWTPINWSGK